MHAVSPPTGLSASVSAGMVTLTWTGSADPEVSGYNIYRSPTVNDPYVLMNGASFVVGTSYQPARPSAIDDPDNFYMVRAVKTENTPAGTYQNMSEGAQVSFPGIPTTYLSILSSPASQTTSVGAAASVAFAVDAVGTESDGNQGMTYQWYKTGDPNPLSDNGHFTGTTSRTLLISGVQLGDAGSYYVVVSNDKGSLASAVATLTTN